VSLPSLAAAVAVALAVGALAGLYPAIRAAQLAPAEALRLT
jgi:putative ABC transport system permease protein